MWLPVLADRKAVVILRQPMHLAELIPTARVPRGGPVWRLPEEPRDLSATRIHADGEPVPLPTFLERTYTDGIIVLHGGHVVMESYFNGMEKRSRHLLMSVSKSVTSAVCSSPSR